MKNVILQGDALTKLKELPEKSINMCMTSPPYWALRKYFSGVKLKKKISKEKKEEIINELNKLGIKPKDI